MFDKLEKLTVLDWISPLIAAVQDVKEGPNTTLFVPEDCGWSGREVTRHLRRHGIKSWGHMCVNGHFMLTIHKNKVKWATYLLDRERVPYEVGR